MSAPASSPLLMNLSASAQIDLHHSLLCGSKQYTKKPTLLGELEPITDPHLNLTDPFPALFNWDGKTPIFKQP